MPASAEPLPARHGKCGVTAGTARQSSNPNSFAGNAGNFTSRQFAACRHASLALAACVYERGRPTHDERRRAIKSHEWRLSDRRRWGLCGCTHATQRPSTCHLSMQHACTSAEGPRTMSGAVQLNRTNGASTTPLGPVWVYARYPTTRYLPSVDAACLYECGGPTHDERRRAIESHEWCLRACVGACTLSTGALHACSHIRLLAGGVWRVDTRVRRHQRGFSVGGGCTLLHPTLHSCPHPLSLHPLPPPHSSVSTLQLRSNPPPSAGGGCHRAAQRCTHGLTAPTTSERDTQAGGAVHRGGSGLRKLRWLSKRKLSRRWMMRQRGDGKRKEKRETESGRGGGGSG
jgi:hypothetical protein